MLPFRNIRDVLGLHAKVSPHKTAVVYYDDQQERLDLSYVFLVGKSHQVANLLYDDLGLGRGDCIAYLGANHENLLLLHFAAWVLGAAIVAADSPALATSGAKILFALHNRLDEAKDIAAKTPSIEGIIQIGGETQADMLRFEDLAAHRPTTFLGDESGAKGADIPVTGGNERTARLDDCALITEKGNFSQGDLMIAAQSLAQAHALTGNQTVLCSLPISDSFALVTSVFAALFVGGTVLLPAQFEVENFWRLVAKEKSHSTSLDASQIAALVAFAKHNEATGLPIYGKKVIQQDVKHFRHIVCADKLLSTTLAREFEEKFGFPILYSYAPAQAVGIVASLALNLSWQKHQALLCEGTQPSFGTALPAYDLAILDDSGTELAANLVGKIAYRVQGGRWQVTKDVGYYRIEDGEKTYFRAE